MWWWNRNKFHVKQKMQRVKLCEWNKKRQKNEMKNMQAFTLYIFVSLFIIGKPTRSGFMQISSFFFFFFHWKFKNMSVYFSAFHIVFILFNVFCFTLKCSTKCAVCALIQFWFRLNHDELQFYVQNWAHHKHIEIVVSCAHTHTHTWI